MSNFRATNQATGEVVEYEADLPQPKHLDAPWALESISDAYVAPTEPDAPPAPAQPMRITKFAFRSRFSQTEKISIEVASLDDPAAPAQRRAMAAALRASQADINVAQFVDLQFAGTRAGVMQLEAVGLLEVGRAAEILDAPPADDEVWNG